MSEIKTIAILRQSNFNASSWSETIYHSEDPTSVLFRRESIVDISEDDVLPTITSRNNVPLEKRIQKSS